MKKLLALLLLLPNLAFAQSQQVWQSGGITPGHPVRWVANGIVGDGGTPGNGLLSGLGVTYNGTGICQSSATNGAFNQLCLGTTTTGGGYLSFYNHAGGTGGLFFNVNGTIYPFPFSGTGTVQSITAGANITLTPNPCITTCTISASGGGGGGGSVNSVSGINANGFTVGVTNPTSTPAITVGTSITGYLLGNGTSVSAGTTTGSGNLVLATGPTIAGETVSGTANFTGTFQYAGNTMTFPGSSSNLGYLVGSATSGHCVQFSGSTGGIADSGNTCGSGGGGGGGSTANRQDFVASLGQFNPGSTTFLNLSSTPVTQNAVTVTFDGVTQAGNTWSLSGSTVNFVAPIPLSVAVVDISWLSASVSVGTVQSVGLNDASSSPIFNITGTPVTSSGTLTETLKVQSPNTVFAGPNSGGTAQPTFRSLVGADLPAPQTSAFGGILAKASATTHNFVTYVDATGTQNLAQPACADISNAGTSCTVNTGTSGATIPLLNGNNTYSGTANFTSTFSYNGNAITFPGVAASLAYFSSAPAAGNCLQTSGTAGKVVDTGSPCGGSGSSPGGASSNVQYNSGSTFAGNSGFTYDGTGTITLGASGTLGSITMGNATSGTINLRPVTGALGTVTLSLPAATATLATTANINTAIPSATSSQIYIGSGGAGLVAVASTLPTAAVPTFAGGDVTSAGGSLVLTVGKIGGKAVTLGGAFTTTGAATPTLAFGTGSYTYTFQGASGTLAALDNADQTVTGGVNISSYSIGTVSSGTTTIDCGTRPQQYLTNGGAFTFAAPSSDGNCLVLITNNGSAGTVTFSGFTAEASHGDALDTTNGHKFTVSVWRVNSTADYRVVAMQ